MPMLETRSLSKWFGGLRALTELDLAVEQGEILGLIGPNGAGKSTTLAVMSGFLPPSAGQVLLEGVDVTKYPPSSRAKGGLARMFQQNALFGSCTVFDSVQVGAHLRAVGSGLGAAVHALSGRRRASVRTEVADILEFVGLADHADVLATSLPHGKKRLLGLAIILASRPRVLLLDEPLTGMNAQETGAMVALINQLRREQGLTFVVVEHNMEAVMNLCDRICVLNFGRQIACGTPAQVSEDEAVIEAYLGVDADGTDGL